jgi:hypothetical protein
MWVMLLVSVRKILLKVYIYGYNKIRIYIVYHILSLLRLCIPKWQFLHLLNYSVLTSQITQHQMRNDSIMNGFSLVTLGGNFLYSMHYASCSKYMPWCHIVDETGTWKIHYKHSSCKMFLLKISIVYVIFAHIMAKTSTNHPMWSVASKFG